MPKFIAMLPVRDEGDVIIECVEAILQWADHLFVFDSGSTDDTYEKIEEMVQTQPGKIVCLGKQSVYFNEVQIRAMIFNEARKVASAGDWMLRVDADEFYHVTPPDFVANFVRPHEHTVYYQLYDFWFTTSDLAGWEAGEETVEDRKKPIHERRRYYSIRRYTQPRMFRYRPSMRWPMNISQPFHSGPIAEERIPIRHYPNRDPVQMKRRLKLRSFQMKFDEVNSCFQQSEHHHWSVQRDWTQLVQNTTDPNVHFLNALSDLPSIRDYSHLPSLPRRMTRGLMDRLGVIGVIDALKPGWSAHMAPQPMSECHVGQIVSEMAADSA